MDCIIDWLKRDGKREDRKNKETPRIPWNYTDSKVFLQIRVIRGIRGVFLSNLASGTQGALERDWVSELGLENSLPPLYSASFIQVR
jgi:hypothetical protein